MNQNGVGFVGGGRIVRIFLEGWSRARRTPSSVFVSDCNPDARAKLQARFPDVQIGTDLAAVAAQEVVFLAVHPPTMADAVASLKGLLKPGVIVVSLAPKFTIAKLTEMLGSAVHIARVIPNAPSIVNSGFNPVCFGNAVTEEERGRVLALLQPLGECPEAEETKLEAYALLTGMGPTYVWFQLQVLREVVQGLGLSASDAAVALKAMLRGSACTLLESGLSPDEVMNLVPVKPLAEMEESVSELYRTRLPAVYQKIKP